MKWAIMVNAHLPDLSQSDSALSNGRMQRELQEEKGDMKNAIDRDHLARQTMGDGDLARSVLEIFVAQMAEKLPCLDPLSEDFRDQVHGLKGSARGVGAWAVADVAEKLEQKKGDQSALLGQLRLAIAEAVQDAERIMQM